MLTQNMGLLVWPAPYLGTDRNGAVDEITRRVHALSPDVVGLCEVFADGERDAIRSSLRSLYPHVREGPDEADLHSDGGLLLLSKHPFLASHDTVFQDCDGADCWANKGVLHVRVHPPWSPAPFDVFYTHAQDIDTPNGANVLYKQLDVIGDFVDEHRDSTAPSLIVGDLNIPAEDGQHYAELLARLSQPIDLWVSAGGTAAEGVTYARDNTFYKEADDAPPHGKRLDYVLLKSGSRFTPIVERCQVLRLTRGGRHISDHFSLHVQFAWMVEALR